MWNSEEVVVVKAEQLGLSSAQSLPQEEEEEEEEERTTAEETPVPPGEAVSMVTGGYANSNTGDAQAETEASGSVPEESEAPVEDEQDPDYDPEGDPFQCHHCHRRFTTRQGLERHTHIHTAAAATAAGTHTLKCRFCTKTFGTQFGRRRHERRHESERKRLGRSASAPASVPTHRPVNAPSAASEPSVTAPSVGAGPPPLKIPARHRPMPARTSPGTEQVAAGDAHGGRGSTGGGEQRGGGASHVCRLCRKAFGTHTNLRRHQRRVHERHLMPRRLTNSTAPPGEGRRTALTQQQTRTSTSSSSDAVGPEEAEPEEGEEPDETEPGEGEGPNEGEEPEQYMMDISSNISKNLSFYIDGKIVSTSAVSNCEVIEVNSGSAAVIGLDTLIISPSQIIQALRMQSAGVSAPCGVIGIPSQSASRRRTATPPLLPQIKTELESEPILTTTSSSSSSPASFLPSTGGAVVGTVVGTVLSQPAEPGGTQKEKTVYLSPKLKQLLQTQDGCKTTFALVADGNRLASPLSLTVLSSSSSRFKRRTGTPPSSAGSTPTSTQQSPAGTPESHESPQERGTPQEPQCSSPPLSLCCHGDPEERSTPSGPASILVPVHPSPVPLDWSEPRTGGSPCNQQPLDLSSAAVSRREGSEELSEAALDLSMPGRNEGDLSMPSRSEGEGEGFGAMMSPALLQLRKAKPSSSMLQQVLMSDYAASLTAPGDQGTSVAAALVTDVAIETAASVVVPADPERLVVELALPPPSLIPVAMQPFTPPLAAGDPTPLPPVLPSSASSPVVMVTSGPAHLLSPEASIISGVETAAADDPRPPGGAQVKALLPNWGDSGVPICLVGGAGTLQSQPAAALGTTTTTDFVTPIPTLQAFCTASVNESAIQSFGIIPNAVVIECTVSLESSQAFVPAFPGGTIEFPGSTIESPYGKIILGPSEHLQPYTTPQLQAPKDTPTAPSAGPSEHLQPYTTPQLQAPKDTPTGPSADQAPKTPPPPPLADPALPAAPPLQETALSAPSLIKDESENTDEPVELTTAPSTALEAPSQAPSQAEEKAVKEEKIGRERLRDEERRGERGREGERAPSQAEEKAVKEEESVQVSPLGNSPLGNSFVCNVCSEPFASMKELGRHVGQHSEAWPYKCEFCVQLFESAELFLEHRSAYHGIGRIYVCSTCSKDFAFLSNLQQHQRDLHPGQTCAHTEVEDGRLRPQNYNSSSSPNGESAAGTPLGGATPPDSGPRENERVTRQRAAKKEEEEKKEEEPEPEQEEEFDVATEELYTTIKVMASGMGRTKGPDVRLGINQHYPSFKPPPFPYHNRTPTGSVASATNFTTHNIPQTFATAIRCTKCGHGFDNMPALHTHILACANASDKRRYTPRKNPVPLKQFAAAARGAQNGVLSPTNNLRQNSVSRKVVVVGGGLGKRPNAAVTSQEESSLAKLKLSALSKRKAQLVQKAVSQRNKSSAAAAAGLLKRSAAGGGGEGEEEQEGTAYVCPYCPREFTYRASLSKHVALSCPNKPASKRARKRKEGAGMSLAQENNGNNVRRRSLADAAVKQQGALQAGEHAGLPHLSKGVMKRSAILGTAQAHPIKRSKNGPVDVLSPIPQSNSSQRSGRPPQNGAEARTQNLQTQPASQPAPLRARERKGGPVTRSLQQARSLAPPAAGQAEVGTAPQPAAPQEGLAGRK